MVVLVDLVHHSLPLKPARNNVPQLCYQTFFVIDIFLSEYGLPAGTAHSLVVNPDLYLDIVGECYMQNRLSAILLILSDSESGGTACCCEV